MSPSRSSTPRARRRRRACERQTSPAWRYARVRMPPELKAMVSRLPDASENCDDVSDDAQSRCRTVAEAPDSQITAALMLAIEPPAADQNGFVAPAPNAYCFAEAPTVQVSPAIALPDDE